ncbi:DUF4941 domain-containing protein [Thermotoga sp. SG1]|uniref:DUF4941 domain-containing protein n=1 Tax=Thermotoga sp. SG1 TaxID=126739 RepID=UPI000C757487|nr:DUF4941 domain-containing protein [Thermotoga sp. SG1]PLV56864.1 hypothetical protein AS006_04520 [Thermotoga sp. SG1]
MKTLWLILILSFTVSLAETFTLDATLLNFDEILQVLMEHSRIFETTPPSTGTVGSLRYLEYNNHVLANVENLYILDNNKLPDPGVPLETLKLFGVDYVQSDGTIRMITCRVNSIEEIGRTIVVNYEGERNFDIEQTEDSMKIVAKDWLVFRGKPAAPGDVLFEKGEAVVEKTAESDGQFRVLLKFKQATGYVVKPLGERIDPFEKDTVFLVGYGDGRVIVRSFSKDLNGLDLPAYSNSLKIAKKIADEMGYRIEICPIYDIPVGVTGVVVLLRDEKDMSKLLDVIERLMKE